MNNLKEVPNKIENWSHTNKTTRWIYLFVEKVLNKMRDSNFNLSPSFLAYSLLLSFIPMLIFLSQLLSIANASFGDSIIKAIDYLPDSSKAFLLPFVKEVLSLRSTSLSILALFSWVWLGSRGFSGLVGSLNEIFKVNKNRGIIFDKIFGFIYLIGFSLIILGLLVFNVFNKKILYLIRKYTAIEEIAPNIVQFFVNGLTSMMPLIIMTIMFLFFFKFAPATDREHKIPFKYALIGSIFTAVSIALITLIYSYTQNISKMNLYYGAMAGILAILIWLLMICQAILFGAIIIASLIEMEKENLDNIEEGPKNSTANNKE